MPRKEDMRPSRLTAGRPTGNLTARVVVEVQLSEDAKMMAIAKGMAKRCIAHVFFVASNVESTRYKSTDTKADLHGEGGSYVGTTGISMTFSEKLPVMRFTVHLLTTIGDNSLADEATAQFCLCGNGAKGYRAFLETTKAGHGEAALLAPLVLDDSSKAATTETEIGTVTLRLSEIGATPGVKLPTHSDAAAAGEAAAGDAAILASVSQDAWRDFGKFQKLFKGQQRNTVPQVSGVLPGEYSQHLGKHQRFSGQTIAALSEIGTHIIGKDPSRDELSHDDQLCAACAAAQALGNSIRYQSDYSGQDGSMTEQFSRVWLNGRALKASGATVAGDCEDSAQTCVTAFNELRRSGSLAAGCSKYTAVTATCSTCDPSAPSKAGALRGGRVKDLPPTVSTSVLRNMAACHEWSQNSCTHTTAVVLSNAVLNEWVKRGSGECPSSGCPSSGCKLDEQGYLLEGTGWLTNNKALTDRGDQATRRRQIAQAVEASGAEFLYPTHPRDADFYRTVNSLCLSGKQYYVCDADTGICGKTMGCLLDHPDGVKLVPVHRDPTPEEAAASRRWLMSRCPVVTVTGADAPAVRRKTLSKLASGDRRVVGMTRGRETVASGESVIGGDGNYLTHTVEVGQGLKITVCSAPN